MTAKIALVDDNMTFAEQMARMLERAGFAANAYGGPIEFFASLQFLRPDLLILDQVMPGITGLELLQRLRTTSDMPCIMLTGSEDEATRIAGLEGGADDYIAKSAPPREILARIHIALRRRPKGPASPGWQFFPAERRLLNPAGEAVRLTSGEFELLKLLHERQGRPVSREDCFNVVFRRSYRPEDRAIDTLVAKLRSKIERESGTGRKIHALRGVGYLFVGFGANSRSARPMPDASLRHG